MPYVVAVPEMLASAATDIHSVGAALNAANVAAAAPTTGVLASGADEVSAAIAGLFSEHAKAYQALSTQAAAFQARFVQALNTAGSAYAATEAANASPLAGVQQEVLAAINAPTQTLLGRPLIGNGGAGGSPGGAGGDGGAGGAAGQRGGSPARRGQTAKTSSSP
jgi:hypothetical protein